MGDWATALVKRESLSQVMDRPNAIGDSASIGLRHDGEQSPER